MNHSEEVLYKTIENLSRQVGQLAVDKALLASQCEELHLKNTTIRATITREIWRGRVISFSLMSKIIKKKGRIDARG